MTLAIDFQTQFPERNSRMGQSLSGIHFNRKHRILELMFDISSYERDEILKSIRMHYAIGMQNMRISWMNELYSLVVQTQDLIIDKDFKDVVLVKYTIKACTDER